MDIKRALKYEFPKFSLADHNSGIKELDACMNLLHLVVYDYKHENYSEKNEVHTYIKNAILNVLIGRNCPAFDNGHNWGYPILAQVCTLIRKKDDLWDLFNRKEKEKISLMMKMFAFMWNFGCNKFNNYRTGIGLHGNYVKTNSPNYVLANNILIIWCIEFFGGRLQDVSRMFVEITYDELIEQLEYYDFRNAYITWTTEGFTRSDGSKTPGARELFGTLEERREHGYQTEAFVYDYQNRQLYYAGWGKGCTLPYYYEGHPANDWYSYPDYLYNQVFNLTFSGGECRSIIHIDSEEDYSAHIVDGTISPYEGLEGMMKEFNIADDGLGQRSSLFHCEIDFNIVCASLVCLKLVKGLNLNDFEDAEKIRVGMNDFIYKFEHGYNGYCLGKIEDEKRNINLTNDTIKLWNEYLEV